MVVPLLLALCNPAAGQDRPPPIRAPYFGAEASLAWPMRVEKTMEGGDALREIADVRSIETTGMLAIVGYRFRKGGADVRLGLGPLMGFTVTDPQLFPGLDIRAALLVHVRWAEPTDLFLYMGFDEGLFLDSEHPGQSFHGDLGLGLGGELFPSVWTQLRMGVAGQTMEFTHASGDRVTFSNLVVTIGVAMLSYRPRKSDSDGR